MDLPEDVAELGVQLRLENNMQAEELSFFATDEQDILEKLLADLESEGYSSFCTLDDDADMEEDISHDIASSLDIADTTLDISSSTKEEMISLPTPLEDLQTDIVTHKLPAWAKDPDCSQIVSIEPVVAVESGNGNGMHY